MYLEFSTFHPYLSFSDDQNHFVSHDGTPTFHSWYGGIEPDEMTDDGADLWDLGKEAFSKLPQFKTIAEFDSYRAICQGNIKSLTLLIAEWAISGKLTFKTPAGKKIVPDLDEQGSSVILGMMWQIGQDQSPLVEVLAHLFLFACLEDIDRAIIGLNLNGGSVRSVIAAVNSYANYQAIESGDEKLQRARSEKASLAAIERYKRDPKQIEKSFIFECWEKWQIEPKQYKGQAGFARSMIEKCEHLTSTKKIEDWCRAWKSKAKSITLLA